MATKKYKTKKDKKSGVAEPVSVYKKQTTKTVRFFSSFNEENNYVAKQRAAQSYDERMLNAENLRRMVFSEYLLPNGKWKAVERTFKIVKPLVK